MAGLREAIARGRLREFVAGFYSQRENGHVFM